MTWQIETTNSSRQGNTVHLFAGPQFLPSMGLPIGPHADFPGASPAVVITRNRAAGQWSVAVGGNSVTITAVNSDYPSAIVGAPRIANTFGDIIDPTKISGTTLTFQVAATGATQDAQGHWHFPSVDGVDLGAFFYKWLMLFGSRCVISGNTITIDITPEKATGTTLNLDPDVVNLGAAYVQGGPGQSSCCFDTADLSAQASWDDIRNVADAGNLDWGYGAVLTWDTNRHQIMRSILRFDTSAIASASAITFNAGDNQYPGPPVRLVLLTNLSDDLGDMSNYGAMVTNSGTDLGTQDPTSQAPVTIPTSAYVSTTKFDICQFEPDYDWTNTEPTTAYPMTNLGFQGWGGGYTAYLEITEGAPPTPPAAPTGLAAGVQSVAITWNAVDGATSYQVWSNTVNDFSTATHVSDGNDPTAASYTDTPSQLPVWYWIVAVNDGGGGTPSAAAQFPPPGAGNMTLMGVGR